MTVDHPVTAPMRVRVVRDIETFAGLDADWDHLLKNSNSRAPFLSWTWYFTWWKHFGPPNELFLVIGEDAAGHLAFVAPLMKRHTKLRGLHVREIRFLENGVGPRNGILIRNELAPQDVATAVLDCLARHQSEWDIAELADIEEHAAYLEPMRRAAAAYEFKALQRTGRTSPLIAMGEDFEQYFTRTFARKHRYNIRKAIRDVHEGIRSNVVCFSRPTDVSRALECAFRVSKASWKGEQSADMACCEVRRDFYNEVTESFAKMGLVQIWLLELDDQAVSVQYQLVSGTTVHLLVSDYDARFQSLSPGTVLLYRVLELMCRRGMKEFDFCGDAYDYKMRWATGARRHVTLHLFGRTCYSKCIFLAKTVLLPWCRSTWRRCRIWTTETGNRDSGR